MTLKEPLVDRAYIDRVRCQPVIDRPRCGTADGFHAPVFPFGVILVPFTLPSGIVGRVLIGRNGAEQIQRRVLDKLALTQPVYYFVQLFFRFFLLEDELILPHYLDVTLDLRVILLRQRFNVLIRSIFRSAQKYLVIRIDHAVVIVLNNVFVGSIIISDLAGIHPDIRQVADFHAVAAGQNNRAQHHERSQNRTNLFPN